MWRILLGLGTRSSIACRYRFPGRAGGLRAGREIASRGRPAARIPEGTLSAHLARGRKLLRDRLLRRGVNLGLGPIAGFSRPIAEAAIPND